MTGSHTADGGVGGGQMPLERASMATATLGEATELERLFDTSQRNSSTCPGERRRATSFNSHGSDYEYFQTPNATKPEVDSSSEDWTGSPAWV